MRRLRVQRVRPNPPFCPLRPGRSTGHNSDPKRYNRMQRMANRKPYDEGGRAMAKVQEDAERLLTPAEVASMFRVDPKTVTRWAKAGKLSSIRTLGGHRRYREAEIRELLSGMMPEQRRGDED